VTDRVLGGVLVGGRSRRMGRPKQFVDIGGGTMIEHVVQAVSGEVDEVVLVGGGPVPASIETLRRVSDADDCRGPMAGILGAMRSQPGACWVMASCDLPLLRPAAVRWLVGERQAGKWAVMPAIDGLPEPLLALYEPAALEFFERAAASGRRALHPLASDPRVLTVEPPAALQRSWFNANTPHDLASLRVG
jgi:molybdopterin-guanine dinucleotide biosynthesis protein A